MGNHMSLWFSSI